MTATDRPTLIVEGLAQARGGRQLFVDVNFRLEAGHALVLMGPNGAGKTTLLRTLAGLFSPVAGRITLVPADGEASVAERAHYVAHANAAKGALTVRENLHFWAAMLGGGRPLDAALDACALNDLSDIPAAYLSAGQKRRLGLARLLVAPRPLWLLDEPTVSLDAASRDAFSAIMHRHLSDGGLIVAATHLPLGLAHAETLNLTGGK